MLRTEPSVDNDQSGRAGHVWGLYSDSRRRVFLIILFLITLSSNFDYYVLGVVLDPIKHEFRVSDTELGLLSGFFFAVCYAVAAMPFARWSDRGNRLSVLTVALTGWSAMTFCFGLAQTFWQLAIARLGVGAMEPGATPPAQSLIADYYPPERRGSALSIMLAGGSLGYLIALALGGYIAARFGWRNAFMLAGALGLVLALVTRTLLAEPRLSSGFPNARHATETSREALVRLSHKRSYVFTLVAVSVFYFFSLGVTTFLPSFMIRSLHVSLEQVSLTWGIAVSVANFCGTLVGGWIADRLCRRDIRWYAWLSAIGCIVGAVLYWWAFAARDLRTFVSIVFLAEFALWAGTLASWAAVHAVCGNRRRGMAIAVLQFAYVLIGGGLGPLCAGAISDALSPVYGERSLQYSLNIMTISLIPAALFFLWSAQTMGEDRER